MNRHEKIKVSSISDLARLAGVSASTVSRALAGSKMISQGTRTLINDLAREHGFQLNQMARNLRLKRSQSIGVVVPLGHEERQNVSDPFFITMLGYLADGVTERGYDVLLTRVVPSNPDWLDALVSSGRIDGVVIIGQSDQLETIDRVAERFHPLVVWGQHQDGQQHCSVGTDNRAGGAMAARHLLDGGRRRLLFAGATELPEVAARYQGFLDAHESAGVEPFGVVTASFTADMAIEAMAEWLKTNEAPDAVVAASDIIATCAIRALQAHGLSVPGDVAVVGYDDVALAAQVTPALTTVRQDLRQGAELLVDHLFRRLKSESTESVVMEPELVVRASAP